MTINFTITTNLMGEDLEVVVASYNNIRLHNVFELLSGVNPTLYLDSKEGIEYPFLVCDKYKQDFTPVYKLLQSSNFEADDGLLSKIAERLSKLNLGVTVDVDFLNSIQKAFKDYTDYVNGKRVKISIPLSKFKHIKETRNLVNSINNSGESKEVYIENNETSFRENCDDELFIRVPSYDQLVMGTSLPRMSDVCNPYSGLKNKDGEDVSKDLSTYKYIKYPEYKDIVLGIPENNGKELFDSERRYYNALKALVNEGYSKEFPNKDIETLRENHIGPKLVLDYFKDLALLATRINWFHSGCLPDTYADDSMDEDNEDSISSASTSESGRSVWVRSGKFSDNFLKNFRDGGVELDKTIESQFNIDPYNCIYVIIQMFRFGKNKPSRIKIRESATNDLDIYWNLSNFTTSSSNGCFSSVDYYYDEDGNNLFPYSIIMASSRINRNYVRDFNVATDNSDINMPIGLICSRRFKNSKFEQSVLLSFIDIIQLYKDNSSLCKIRGLSYNNGSFTIDDSFVQGLLNNDKSFRVIMLSDALRGFNDNNNNAYRFLNYDGFTKAFMEIKSFNVNSLSSLTLLDEYLSTSDLSILAFRDYSSRKELEDVVKNLRVTPVECVKAHIARYELPVVYKASMLFNNCDDDSHEVCQAFNSFVSAFDTLGFTGNFSIDDIKSDNLTNLQSSNVFSDDNSIEEDDFVSKVIEGDLKDNDSSSTIYAILCPNSRLDALKSKCKCPVIVSDIVQNNHSVVGYFYINASNPKVKIFLDPKEKRQYKGIIMIDRVTPALFSILREYLSGANLNCKFSNNEVGLYYTRLLTGWYNSLC